MLRVQRYDRFLTLQIFYQKTPQKIAKNAKNIKNYQKKDI